MVKKLQARFGELVEQLDHIGSTRQSKHSEYTGSYEEVDADLLLGWLVKARNLLSTACGRESEHYESFAKAETPGIYESNFTIYKRVRAVFMAAKEDFEGGYLVSVRHLVQAEIADSELDQARELLASGYHTAAAVVAGIVLETTLRSLCDAQGIAHGKLDKMNADLVKAGQYNSLVQKKITFLAGVRNSAAHGKPEEFKPSDVESMISEVERFASNAYS